METTHLRQTDPEHYPGERQLLEVLSPYIIPPSDKSIRHPLYIPYPMLDMTKLFSAWIRINRLRENMKRYGLKRPYILQDDEMGSNRPAPLLYNEDIYLEEITTGSKHCPISFYDLFTINANYYRHNIGFLVPRFHHGAIDIRSTSRYANTILFNTLLGRGVVEHLHIASGGSDRTSEHPSVFHGIVGYPVIVEQYFLVKALFAVKNEQLVPNNEDLIVVDYEAGMSLPSSMLVRGSIFQVKEIFVGQPLFPNYHFAQPT